MNQQTPIQTTSAEPAHLAYRPEIDGLRAVAVLAVAAFHAFPTLLPGGFVGVDVFFVISGYLITGIILDALRRGRFSFLGFYARRVRRIFPALAVVLLACLVAGWFLLLPDEYAQLGKHTAAAGAFVSNFVLWGESGYFDQDASTKILLHFWSLAIEEQFYLVWPLLLVLTWRLRWPPALVVSALLIASFAMNLLNLGSDPTGTFYSPQTRAWELLVGALLSVTSFTLPAAWRAFLGVFGIALIGGAALMLNETTPFPGVAALLPTIGAAFVITGASSGPIGWALSTPPARNIGLISYPLYLWHWPLLVFPTIILGEAISWQISAVCLACAALLASATFYLVERPLRRRGALPTKALAGLTGVATLSALGLTVLLNGGLSNRATIAPYIDADQRVELAIAWPFAENDVCLRRFPFPHRQEGWSFCVMERDEPPTLFLVGNSFANHLYPGLADHQQLAHQNVLQFGTCYPLVDVSFSAYGRDHPCGGFKGEAQASFTTQIVVDNPSIRFAILSAPWPAFDDEGRAVAYEDMSREDGVFRSIPPVPGESSYDAFFAGLERRVVQLLDAGVTPILFLATPQLQYSPEACVAVRPLRLSSQSCEVSVADEKNLHARFNEGVRFLVSRHPHLLVFDPAASFCGEETCHLANAEEPWLRDVRHLTVAASRRLAVDFVSWAEENAPEILSDGAS